MHLHPLACLALFCTFLTLPTGAMVLLKNLGSNINRSFFIVCLGITLWQSYFYIVYTFDHNLPIIQTWHKVIYCGITFMPIAALHNVTEILNLKFRSIWNRINYIVGGIISVLIFQTKFILDGEIHYSWGYYPRVGKFHDYFALYTIVLIGTVIYLLIHKGILAEKDARRRNQLKYMLLGYVTLATSASDYRINYGVDNYPVAYISATIFILIIAYAIVQYKLMDINVIIKKSLAYSFLITSVTVLYALLVVIFSRIFQIQVGLANLTPSIFAALLIAAFFYPLHNKIQTIIDRLFLHATPLQIAQENALLRQEVEKSERHKAIATLASGIAHEIKNPLTALRTFSDYLPQRLEDKEFLGKFSKIVGQEVSRIDDMVNQLLDFARPAPLTRQPANLNQLIRNTLEFLNSKFLKHKIRLKTELDPACDLPIEIDANKFKQALLNVLLNAADAMPDGGDLIVTTHKTRKWIEITIEDTGPGIAVSDLPHIFEPFFSKKEHGTGLGLPITEGIINEHQGRITADSPPGGGARFRIKMPL